MSLEIRPRVTTESNTCIVVDEGGRETRYPLFQYEPLAFGRKIRLLKLQKEGQLWPLDRLSGSNEFSLHEHELDNTDVSDLDTSKSPFYAISYYWGEPIFDTPLFVNVRGQCKVLPITATAWEAVQRLAPAIDDLGKFMWIDQICINQANEVEKARQVALMGEIYRRCWHCMIWLGCASVNTDTAFSLLRRLERSLPLDQTVRLKLLDVTFSTHSHIRNQLTMTLGEDVLPPATDPGWAELARLLQRDWFSRLWTFQEAVLCYSGDATVCCGEYHIPLLTLMRGSMLLGNEHSFDNVDFSDGSGALSQINIFRESIEQNEKTPLIWLLQNNNMRQCTDPRDRIYALLGLRNEDGPEYVVPVNYRISAQDLFVEVARASIRAQGSLRICAEAPERAQDSGLKGLPSWVPDWTRQPLMLTFENITSVRSYFNASNGRAHVDDMGDRMILKVRGKAVDSVMGLVDAEIKDGITHIRRREKLTDQILPLLHSLLRFRSSETTEPSLAYAITDAITLGGFSRSRAVIGDSGLPPTAWSEAVCSHMFSTILGGIAPTTTSESGIAFDIWMDALTLEATLCANRRFAMLEHRLLGVVPQATAVGDQITILHGSTLPFVLRRLENDCYKLVGACYVDGIMRGESVDWTDGDTFYVC